MATRYHYGCHGNQALMISIASQVFPWLSNQLQQGISVVATETKIHDCCSNQSNLRGNQSTSISMVAMETEVLSRLLWKPKYLLGWPTGSNPVSGSYSNQEFISTVAIATKSASPWFPCWILPWFLMRQFWNVFSVIAKADIRMSKIQIAEPSPKIIALPSKDVLVAGNTKLAKVLIVYRN